MFRFISALESPLTGLTSSTALTKSLPCMTHPTSSKTPGRTWRSTTLQVQHTAARQWAYILKFFEMDNNVPTRKAPKLTKGNFALNSFTKTRVNKAAQVLSHTVSAGLYIYVALGRLPAEAVHTADFVGLVDGLFDASTVAFSGTQSL